MSGSISRDENDLNDWEPDGEYHMFPNDDILLHEESYLCACQPFKLITVSNLDNGDIWIHRQVKGMLN